MATRYTNRCCATTIKGTRCKKNKTSENFCTVHRPRDVCSICLCDNTYQTKLSCKHNFCVDCINTWLVEKPSCPYCRTQVTKNELVLAFDYGIYKQTIKKVISRKYSFRDTDKNTLEEYGFFGNIIVDNDMNKLLKNKEIFDFFKTINYTETQQYYKMTTEIYIPDIIYFINFI